MASTIRIQEEDKKILETLINYIAFRTNRRLTQEEMIGVLVKVGDQDKDRILTEIEAPVENEFEWQNDPIFSGPKLHLGKDASRSIDQDIYGHKGW